MWVKVKWGQRASPEGRRVSKVVLPGGRVGRLPSDASCCGFSLLLSPLVLDRAIGHKLFCYPEEGLV